MRTRTITKTIGILVAAYMGIYFILALFGGYRFDQSGTVRYVTGLSASDLEMWHPAIAWYQNDFQRLDGRITTRGNLLGYLFSPLIRLDRAMLHKTRVIEQVRQAGQRAAGC